MQRKYRRVDVSRVSRARAQGPPRYKTSYQAFKDRQYAYTRSNPYKRRKLRPGNVGAAEVMRDIVDVVRGRGYQPRLASDSGSYVSGTPPSHVSGTRSSGNASMTSVGRMMDVTEDFPRGSTKRGQLGAVIDPVVNTSMVVPGNITPVNYPSRPYRINNAILIRDITAGSAEVTSSHTWHMDSVADYTHLVQFFDQYRFVEIEVLVLPTTNPNTTFTVTQFPKPFLYVVVDFDSAATITENEALTKDNCYIFASGTGGSFKFIPRVLMEIESAGALVSGSNPDPGWINTLDAEVNHYGIRFVVSATAPGTALNWPSWRIMSRMVLEFKNRH